jgi:PAS domain S-box-containing protein
MDGRFPFRAAVTRLSILPWSLVTHAMTVSPDQQPTAPSPPQGGDAARLVVESMPGLAWSASPDGTIERASSRFLAYVGEESQDLGRAAHPPDLSWVRVLHTEDVERSANVRARAAETGEPYELDHRVRRFDGTYRWFRLAAQAMRDGDGQVMRWYGVHVDIDDRNGAEGAIGTSEASPPRLFDALPVIVWRATPDGRPNYMNRRAARLAGMSGDEAVNFKWKENFVHPDDVAMVAEAWNRAVETETPFDVVSRHREADGSYHWFHTRAEPLRDDGGRVIHWYGVDVDVDGSKRTEDALRSTQAALSRASELATMSQLAASIAHEISQPLAALVANGHAAHRWLSANPPNLERALITAERIIRDGNAAAEVVRRIRALFKRTDSTRAPLNLNEVIAEVGRLMADEVSSRNVSIDIDLDGDLPPILADRVQMQQVIINLARNGVDAMESEEGQVRTLSIRSRRDGMAHVLIEIRDQGKGLEDVERVFEPFVTTKEQGMGMGLAICRWIVEAHDGRLWATTNDPRGATFSVTLPIRLGESR